MTNKEKQEQLSISAQSDDILSYMQDRFHQLMTEDRMEDAISIGDEYIEWMKADPDEVYLYFTTTELNQEYMSRQQE